VRLTPTLCKAGLAVATTALLALPVAAANATTKTNTMIVLSGLPARISYGRFQQTVQGVLETRVPSGQTPQPISGAVVQVLVSANKA
jgi:hypothetical protein